MDYIGGIDGMNFSPIGNYNNYLKNNMALDIDSTADFEKILNQQSARLQNSQSIQGGVEMNSFDNVLAKTAVQGLDNSESAGNFLDNFSSAIGKGLNNTNDAVRAAEKAQEAFAMGEDVSVHDVMIASEKANLNMALTMQLRNKLLTAYNEINQVRV